jgi:Phage integrase family
MKNPTDIGITRATSVASPTPPVPTSLSDLLLLINRKNGTQEAMLHAVATRFLLYVRLTADQVSIETMHDQKELFIAHLKAGKDKASSVKSYRNYMNVLLRRAREAGWVCPKFVLTIEWQAIADVMPRGSLNFIVRIVRYVTRIGKVPGSLCEDDLAAWRQERAKAGRSLQDAETDCSRFRAAIVRAGLSAKFPLIKPRAKCYGIALADMHPDLRREVEDTLEWKQNDFQLDRPSGARIRASSAKRLSNLFSLATGYVQNVAHEPEVTSLSDLITRDHIAGYATWAINTRKVKGQPLSTGLGMIYAALRHNPRYKALNLSWFANIVDQLPVEPQSTIDQRKARKYIPYAEAEQIPDRIRAQRKKAKSPNPHTLAIHARNELLMLWLVILPWRQMNIRDCRITGNTPNLFDAPISPFSMISRSSWVAEQECASPGTSFWQIHFDPRETKTKNEVNAFLPSELVPLVKEYLSIHRPVLVDKSVDPGTLFVSNVGKRMDLGQMINLVKKLASAHTGVPVTPHLYRDIVAFEWLRVHPEDYLTLSKLLWHRNINTTLRIYGRRFDESTGVARMDDWRTSRSKTA